MNSVCIIGGGASGLAAAITAAKNKAEVTVFEKKDRVGKKILSTGNGKCNFSNLNMSADCYYTEDKEFLDNILNKVSVNEVISFFKENGLLIKEKNGYLYPYSEQASSVLDVLRFSCEELGVHTFTDSTVTNVKPLNKGFEVTVNDSKKYTFDKVIFSSGGMAGLGKNEKVNGYSLLKNLGYRMNKLYPSLTQIKSESLNFKGLSGVRSECILEAFEDDEAVMKQRGEILFTDYGISGIVSFQVSHFVARALDEKKNVKLVLNLLPDFSEADLKQFLEFKLLLHPGLTVEEFLTGFFNKKINFEIMKKSGLKGNEPINAYSREDLFKALSFAKNVIIVPTGVNGFENAQVTGGGILLEQFSPNMESLMHKGLYVTGELLDVDGICGGYNLQWAFSTGIIAGENAAVS